MNLTCKITKTASQKRDKEVSLTRKKNWRKKKKRNVLILTEEDLNKKTHMYVVFFVF